MQPIPARQENVTTTVIEKADWVIAWIEAAGRHFYRRGIDIVFVDDTITFVGRNYPGAADRVIDGRDRLALPGLIDIHSHPEHEPLYRGVREEHGVRNMHMTGLYERSQAFSAPDDEARAASAEFAYCELLLSGVTSLVDISPAWDGWVDLLARGGFQVRRVTGSGVPMALALPQWSGLLLVRILERLSFESARIWKRLFAYQFIVRAGH